MQLTRKGFPSGRILRLLAEVLGYDVMPVPTHVEHDSADLVLPEPVRIGKRLKEYLSAQPILIRPNGLRGLSPSNDDLCGGLPDESIAESVCQYPATAFRAEHETGRRFGDADNDWIIFGAERFGRISLIGAASVVKVNGLRFRAFGCPDFAVICFQPFVEFLKWAGFMVMGEAGGAQRLMGVFMVKPKPERKYAYE